MDETDIRPTLMYLTFGDQSVFGASGQAGACQAGACQAITASAGALAHHLRG